jgi:hypothetical protein
MINVADDQGWRQEMAAKELRENERAQAKIYQTY